MAKILDKDPATYERERDAFFKDLLHFHETRGTPIKRPPKINGTDIDLYMLYVLVTGRGGWYKVNSKNEWDVVLESFNVPRHCVNSGVALKQVYLRYLDRYEKVHFLGEVGERSNDEDEDSRHRRWSARALHSVPLTYNQTQHNVCDSLRSYNGLATDLYKPSDYDRLALSLISPLPNEQDFAINVCTLLSNEGRHTLKLDRHPRILHFLLAHAAVFNHCSIRDLFSEQYNRVRGHSLSHFWRDVLDEPDLMVLLDETRFSKRKKKYYTIKFDGSGGSGGEKSGGAGGRVIAPLNDDVEMKELVESMVVGGGAAAAGGVEDRAAAGEDPEGGEEEKAAGEEEEDGEKDENGKRLRIFPEDRELFCLGRSLGTQDYFGQRVLQIAMILRNLSFTEENVEVMGKDVTFVRFVLLCCGSRWNALHQMGLDMLANVASEITLSDLILDPMLCVITKGLESQDRSIALSSIEVLNKLGQNESNEELLLRCLEDKVYQRICELLTLQDIMMLVHTLECLYSLSSLGERSCNSIVRVHGALDTLVSLLTVEAQSYGPKACVLMRVVETVSTTGPISSVPASSVSSALPATSTATTSQPATVSAAGIITTTSSVLSSPSSSSSPSSAVTLSVATPLPTPAIARLVSSPMPAVASTMAGATTQLQMAQAHHAHTHTPATAAISSATSSSSSSPSTLTHVPHMITTQRVMVPVTSSTQQVAQENEQFALGWLRSTFDQAPGSRIEQGELYKQYITSCAKIGRRGVIAPNHFPRCVRTVFGMSVGPKQSMVGETAVHSYEGIQVRGVKTTSCNSSSATPSLNTTPSSSPSPTAPAPAPTHIHPPGSPSTPLHTAASSSAPAHSLPISPILKAQLCAPPKPNTTPSKKETKGKVVKVSTHPHLSQALLGGGNSGTMARALVPFSVSAAGAVTTTTTSSGASQLLPSASAPIMIAAVAANPVPVTSPPTSAAMSVPSSVGGTQPPAPSTVSTATAAMSSGGGDGLGSSTSLIKSLLANKVGDLVVVTSNAPSTTSATGGALGGGGMNTLHYQLTQTSSGGASFALIDRAQFEQVTQRQQQQRLLQQQQQQLQQTPVATSGLIQVRSPPPPPPPPVSSAATPPAVSGGQLQPPPSSSAAVSTTPNVVAMTSQQGGAVAFVNSGPKFITTKPILSRINGARATVKQIEAIMEAKLQSAAAAAAAEAIVTEMMQCDPIANSSSSSSNSNSNSISSISSSNGSTVTAAATVPTPAANSTGLNSSSSSSSSTVTVGGTTVVTTVAAATAVSENHIGAPPPPATAPRLNTNPGAPRPPTTYPTTRLDMEDSDSTGNNSLASSSGIRDNCSATGGEEGENSLTSFEGFLNGVPHSLDVDDTTSKDSAPKSLMLADLLEKTVEKKEPPVLNGSLRLGERGLELSPPPVPPAKRPAIASAPHIITAHIVEHKPRIVEHGAVTMLPHPPSATVTQQPQPQQMVVVPAGAKRPSNDTSIEPDAKRMHLNGDVSVDEPPEEGSVSSTAANLYAALAADVTGEDEEEEMEDDPPPPPPPPPLAQQQQQQQQQQQHSQPLIVTTASAPRQILVAAGGQLQLPQRVAVMGQHYVVAQPQTALVQGQTQTVLVAQTPQQQGTGTKTIIILQPQAAQPQSSQQGGQGQKVIVQRLQSPPPPPLMPASVTGSSHAHHHHQAIATKQPVKMIRAAVPNPANATTIVASHPSSHLPTHTQVITHTIVSSHHSSTHATQVVAAPHLTSATALVPALVTTSSSSASLSSPLSSSAQTTVTAPVVIQQQAAAPHSIAGTTTCLGTPTAHNKISSPLAIRSHIRPIVPPVSATASVNASINANMAAVVGHHLPHQHHHHQQQQHTVMVTCTATGTGTSPTVITSVVGSPHTISGSTNSRTATAVGSSSSCSSSNTSSSSNSSSCISISSSTTTASTSSTITPAVVMPLQSTATVSSSCSTSTSTSSAAAGGTVTSSSSSSSASASASPTVPTTVQQQGHFLCEWRGCMRNFKSANEVYMHACESHCPSGSQEIQCLWERCDAMKRKRFSLMTHLYDRHCNADVLRMMAVRRKQLSVSGRSEIPAPSPPTPHPGYAPNAAFHAIKRHALEFVNPKELQDDNEGPVTKSIRLTSALILRNLVIYSTYGRRYLTSYEPHLASVALSNVESSRTIAQVLFDMSQPR